ncbi:hypothetical protein RUND412_009625 [Rhizina undulata]
MPSPPPPPAPSASTTGSQNESRWSGTVGGFKFLSLHPPKDSTQRNSPVQALANGQSRPTQSASNSRTAAPGKRPATDHINCISDSESNSATETTKVPANAPRSGSRPLNRQPKPSLPAQQRVFIEISSDDDDEVVLKPSEAGNSTQASGAAASSAAQELALRTLSTTHSEPQKITHVSDSSKSETEKSTEDRRSQFSKTEESQMARKGNKFQFQNSPEIILAARKSTLRSAIPLSSSEPPAPALASPPPHPPPPPPMEKRPQPHEPFTMTTRRITRMATLTPASSDLTRASSSLTPTPVEVIARETTSPPKPTNFEKYDRSCRMIEDEIRERMPEMKTSLQQHIAEMRKDHGYIVKNSLAAARLDMEQLYKPQNNPIGIGLDEVSPFSDMKSIEMETKPKDMDVEKFYVRVFVRHHTWQNRFCWVPVTVAKTPRSLNKVPKYHSYTTLRNNILAEDDEVMRYIPYFGEGCDDGDIDAMNFAEAFEDKTRLAAEEGKKVEWAHMYSYFIEDFLKEFDLTFESITSYFIGNVKRLHGGINPTKNEQIRKEALPDDFNSSASNMITLREKLREVTIEELERAELVCKVFKECTKISLWNVVKIVNDAVKNSLAPNKVTGSGGTLEDDGTRKAKEKKQVSELTGVNPRPYSLESYSALSCVLCYMHECPYHDSTANNISIYLRESDHYDASESNHGNIPNHIVNKDQDRVAMAAAEEANAGKPSKKGGDGLILNFPTSLPGWSYSNKSAAINAWGDMTTECSPKCFVTASPAKIDAPLTVWTQAQLELFYSSVSVFKNNPRCACMIIPVINKPCYEIYGRLKLENLLPEPEASVEDTGTVIEPTSTICEPNSKHVATWAPAPRPVPASSPASPARNLVPVHPTAAGGGEAATVNARDKKRAYQTGVPLDPVNRYDPTFVETHCQNIWLQRDMPKRTLLGISSVAGFGLLMGQDVKAGEFLGEYKGEVISSEEAERRGKVYDKRGVSFLFNLNQNQVIDATRAGNKFRYVNHSSKRPNCVAKVLMANCTHRIGMYAKKDISAGEELFFDYGSVFVEVMRARGEYRELFSHSDVESNNHHSYNNKTVKFVQKEPPDLSNLNISFSSGSSSKRKDGENGKKKKVAHPKLAYLKGGKGTTERTRPKGMKEMKEKEKEMEMEKEMDDSAGSGPANVGSRRYDGTSRDKSKRSFYEEDSMDDGGDLEIEEAEAEPEIVTQETEADSLQEAAMESDNVDVEEYQPERDSEVVTDFEEDEEDEGPRSAVRRRRVGAVRKRRRVR